MLNLIGTLDLILREWIWCLIYLINAGRCSSVAAGTGKWNTDDCARRVAAGRVGWPGQSLRRLGFEITSLALCVTLVSCIAGLTTNQEWPELQFVVCVVDFAWIAVELVLIRGTPLEPLRAAWQRDPRTTENKRD